MGSIARQAARSLIPAAPCRLAGGGTRFNRLHSLSRPWLAPRSIDPYSTVSKNFVQLSCRVLRRGNFHILFSYYFWRTPCALSVSFCFALSRSPINCCHSATIPYVITDHPAAPVKSQYIPGIALTSAKLHLALEKSSAPGGGVRDSKR